MTQRDGTMGRNRIIYCSLALAMLLIVSPVWSQCPPEALFDGTGVNDRCGRQVVGSFDFNLDGYDDIFVSAPLSGKVNLFSGGHAPPCHDCSTAGGEN
ncbi:MAG: hypothetical protein P1R58_10125 [bacterium]|nr:hypothetical protein [bacterium]